MDSIPECIQDLPTRQIFECFLIEVPKLPIHARNIAKFCQKVNQISQNRSENLISDILCAYKECDIPCVYDSIHGEGKHQDNDFIQKCALNPIEDIKLDEAKFLEHTNKHCKELANALLCKGLCMDGVTCVVTIISIYLEAQQVAQFSEELKQILTRVNDIYETNVKEALLILYNRQIDKTGEARVHLMSAEKALQRELENLEAIKAKSQNQGFQTLNRGLSSAISCYSRLSSLYSLAECVSNWVFFSNSAIGFAQFVSTAWSLKLTYGHWKNYQQANEAIAEIKKYILCIKDSKKLIDDISNGQFDEKMEKKLIDIQIQVDEFLAGKFENDEKKRVKQIEEDIEYAKKLAATLE